MKTHEVKIWPQGFDAVRNGKSFEVRKDDRGYKVGDKIILEEYRPGMEYTGRKLERTIINIARGDNVEADGLRAGYCVLGLGIVERLHHGA